MVIRILKINHLIEEIEKKVRESLIQIEEITSEIMTVVIEKENHLIEIIEKKEKENLTQIEKITSEIMKVGIIKKETLEMIDVQEKIIITTKKLL